MWCLCFLICCLGLSYLSFQGASVFEFHACSYCPQWFRTPTKENLSLLPLLLAMKWWDQISSVQLLSGVRLFATPWTAAHQASLSITNPGSLLKLMSIKSMMPSNHLILCHPILLLPSIFHNIRVFSNESALHIRWPNYWSFSFSNSPSNIQGWLPLGLTDLISWIQGTLKSLLQHHNSKTWILRCSAFLNVQLSHPYMTVRQTIPLTRQTFIDKVMSLLCDMLSRLIIAFLPRSKRLLISWLQSPSVVILEPPK